MNYKIIDLPTMPSQDVLKWWGSWCQYLGSGFAPYDSGHSFNEIGVLLYCEMQRRKLRYF